MAHSDGTAWPPLLRTTVLSRLVLVLHAVKRQFQTTLRAALAQRLLLNGAVGRMSKRICDS